MTDQHTESDPELESAFMAIWGDPELSANPQPAHRALRAKGDVLRLGPMVMLNTREKVESALRQPEIFSSQMDSARLGNTRPLIPMQIDPPDHRAYRRLLDPLYGPREVAPLEPVMVEVINDLIDRIIDKGSCDFTTEVATPYPCTVFLHQLGLPLADLDELVRIKDGIVHPPRHDVAEMERVQNASGQQLYRYFEAAVAAKQAAPGEDLLSRLLGSKVGDRPVTVDEVVDILYLLVLAGLDTVSDSLALMYVYLARHPEHRAQLVADPGLVPAAVEELLRWESPVPGVPRMVVGEGDLGGCPVHPGDFVYIGFGAANDDEGALPDADEVRFDRETNRHLAFGGGIHKCLGAHLARVQLRVALTEWHRRIPDYEIPAGTELDYLPGLRSVAHLPLTFPGR
jgi:cytochrome P450